MSIEIKYIPLSFINTDEEILKQMTKGRLDA